jgi:hypothetical protein
MQAAFTNALQTVQNIWQTGWQLLRQLSPLLQDRSKGHSRRQSPQTHLSSIIQARLI